ncbi:hypothetical protein DFH28DRAFT_1184722 [Melampsora americana]|nr:hypothetical protein DFH28DRAFT_1184722 [Melampsora americana]
MTTNKRTSQSDGPTSKSTSENYMSAVSTMNETGNDGHFETMLTSQANLTADQPSGQTESANLLQTTSLSLRGNPVGSTTLPPASTPFQPTNSISPSKSTHPASPSNLSKDNPSSAGNSRQTLGNMDAFYCAALSANPDSQLTFGKTTTPILPFTSVKPTMPIDATVTIDLGDRKATWDKAMALAQLENGKEAVTYIKIHQQLHALEVHSEIVPTKKRTQQEQQNEKVNPKSIDLTNNDDFPEGAVLEKGIIFVDGETTSQVDVGFTLYFEKTLTELRRIVPLKQGLAKSSPYLPHRKSYKAGKHQANIESFHSLYNWMTAFRDNITIRKNFFVHCVNIKKALVAIDIAVRQNEIGETCFAKTRRLNECEYKDSPYTKGGPKFDFNYMTGLPCVKNTNFSTNNSSSSCSSTSNFNPGHQDNNCSNDYLPYLNNSNNNKLNNNHRYDNSHTNTMYHNVIPNEHRGKLGPNGNWYKVNLFEPDYDVTKNNQTTNNT